MSSSTSPASIRIGISSCLLGNAVRYDGRHRCDHYITRTLGRYFDFVPVCPEVAIGLGVPRPPIRLTGDVMQPHAVGVEDDSLDVTRPLAAYAGRMARELDDISGYIFKARSPSCGVGSVPVHGNRSRTQASGVFAAGILAAMPLLPVEQEDRLGDPVRRENFLGRVLVYHRWQGLVAQGVSAARVVEFHTAHKLVVMAHGAEHYRRIGRLVAQAGRQPVRAFAREYIGQLMEALAHHATPKRHANVLMHLMGYLKKQLTPADKAELLALIDACRLGQMPLITAHAVLRHHFRRHPDDYVARQYYLYPPAGEPELRGL